VETTTQDLAARIERLEQTMSRAHLNADPFAKMSFAGWLKLSGPTFAVMLCGFTLLWNSQETMRSQMLELDGATNTRMLDLNESTNARMLELHESSTAQILELSRVTGRLEGAIGRLESSIDRLDASVAELRVDVRRLGERVDALEH
jgi:outer membrane murein-binding lipoprotein Lpp